MFGMFFNHTSEANSRKYYGMKNVHNQTTYSQPLISYINLQVLWNPAVGSDVSWLYAIPWKRKSGGDAISHEWG